MCYFVLNEPLFVEEFNAYFSVAIAPPHMILLTHIHRNNCSCMKWMIYHSDQQQNPCGGFCIFPCICCRNGLNICPAGVSSRCLAWLQYFSSIPLPVRNSAAQLVNMLQLWLMISYFSVVYLKAISFRKSQQISCGISVSPSTISCMGLPKGVVLGGSAQMPAPKQYSFPNATREVWQTASTCCPIIIMLSPLAIPMVISQTQRETVLLI